MNVFLYLIIFAIGTLCGSFLTLATYRIPIHKDITHERSFCPNCNHELSFFDLIPIFSYICLGGKCKYCKKRISPRYLIFECFTGLSFVFTAYALEINAFELTPNKIIEFIIIALYFIFLLLIAGIDFKYKKIEKGTLIFGISVSCLNIMYHYIAMLTHGSGYNLNRIIFYLILIILTVIINVEMIRKTKKYDYSLDLFLIMSILGLNTNEIVTISSVIGFLLMIFFSSIIRSLYSKKGISKNKTISKIPCAFYLIVSHFIILAISYLYSLNIF